jgi:hypothetical protein
MEYLTLVNYFLVMSVPVIFWNNLDEVEQDEVVSHIASCFFREYNCSKADLIIKEGKEEVEFYFRRTDYKI